MDKLIITFWHNYSNEYEINDYYKFEQTKEHIIIYYDENYASTDVFYKHNIKNIEMKEG